MKQQKSRPKTETVAVVFDPICGMQVYSGQAFVRRYDGRMYYFCCPECKKVFENLVKNNATFLLDYDSTMALVYQSKSMPKNGLDCVTDRFLLTEERI